MRRYSLLLLALLAAVSPVRAQDKAGGFFDELQHDFGPVPRGQTVSHPFRIVNNTKEVIHIRDVRVSCKICADARVLQDTLQPGQETAIIGIMKSANFIGTKQITIYVSFDKPHREEVRLWMQANSREDVTFSPDSIAFGTVKRGAEPESKITVTFLGGAETKITEVKSDSNYVPTTMKQLNRTATETSYEISAKLRKDTPAGKWYTDIWLKTNNGSIAKLRIPVTVEVEAPLSVSPNSVTLGQVKAGTESDRKVIIRGVRPFSIKGIIGTDKQLQVRAASNESKTVHVLTVTLNPMEPGDLSRRITVQTDLPTGGDIEFDARAQVIP